MFCFLYECRKAVGYAIIKLNNVVDKNYFVHPRYTVVWDVICICLIYISILGGNVINFNNRFRFYMCVYN